MPYFGLHYGGTYSVNPLGIRRDSEAPSRGRMDRRTTSAAGLASSRGTRLLREAAFGAAALAMALGLAVWVTDFDLADWINPASANVGSHRPFVRRALWPGLGAPFAGLMNYPWRPASPAGTEFRCRVRAHRRPRWADPAREEQNVQPAPSAPTAEAAIPLPTGPAGPGQSSVIEERSGSRLRRTTAPCSRSSPIWCR